MALSLFCPRHYLLPDPFAIESIAPYWLNQSVFNELNVGNAIGRVIDDDKEFAVEVDVSQFHPKELSVNVRDDELVIEGHQEQRNDANGKIERHFVRKYAIPKNACMETVESHLNDRGVLRVSAHKKGVEESRCRNIPIRAAQRDADKAPAETKQK